MQEVTTARKSQYLKFGIINPLCFKYKLPNTDTNKSRNKNVTINKKEAEKTIISFTKKYFVKELLTQTKDMQQFFWSVKNVSTPNHDNNNGKKIKGKSLVAKNSKRNAEIEIKR